jgi:hypothetical protein
MTRQLTECDAKLELLRRLLSEATCPDDLASLYEDIDTLLDMRLLLSSGTARGGRNAV